MLAVRLVSRIDAALAGRRPCNAQFEAGVIRPDRADTYFVADIAATCEGKFRFGYARRNREALIALAPGQPDLRSRLTLMLVRPDYPVAELGCGEGDTTYVLLGDRDLVAIYRDAGVAGIERLSRS